MLTAEPRDVGMDAVRLGRLDGMTHRYVDEGRLPGIVTVIERRGQIVHHDRYGWADVESRRELADDDIFRIYSMTKPITSLALMLLYEEGRVLLENPVSRFIPGFADTRVWESGDEHSFTTTAPERAMTVHDVLTHMSGLTAGFQFQHPVDAMYRANGLGDLSRPDMTLTDGIDLLATMPLLFTPGSRWAYGASTDVVGRIVEVISGQTLDSFIRERILDPLRMDDTEFWVEPDQVHRLTTNYFRGRDRTLRAVDRPESSEFTSRPAFLSGAGGLVSTAADYQRFLSMLVAGGELDGVRIVGPRTLRYMTQNHLPGGATLNDLGQSTFSEAAMAGTGFGLGFSVVVDPPANQSMTSVGEYSWGGAASTAFWVDPAEEMTVLFLTQLLPSNLYPIRRQLRATVYQSLVD